MPDVVDFQKTLTPGMPGQPKSASEVEYGKAEDEISLDLNEVYSMTYRKNQDVLSKNFYFPKTKGGLREAIDRAKLHCERMRFRFLYCVPLIRDLEAEEKRMDSI